MEFVQTQPILSGNYISRGNVRCVLQRCIGYQQYNADNARASVIETTWNDGVITYHFDWIDADGMAQLSECTDRLPRIDIPL